MDPAITGCPPGGATYHSWGYKVISDIFMKIAISPKFLNGLLVAQGNNLNFHGKSAIPLKVPSGQ